MSWDFFVALAAFTVLCVAWVALPIKGSIRRD